MLSRRSPLLTRLRRHRGWFALVFAVLLVKLMSSSICLGDGLPRAIAVEHGGAAVMATASVDTGGTCLLGEGADCHCACAHSLTVTSTGIAAPIPIVPAAARTALVVRDHAPAFHGSLLRPPIA